MRASFTHLRTGSEWVLRQIRGLMSRRPFTCWYRYRQASASPIPLERSEPLLYAIVVGIDTVRSIRDTTLEGATGDATRVVKYLHDWLGVHESRICLLLNGQATREAILEAIMGLATHPYVWPQDPILIFYAGLGTTMASDDPRAGGGTNIECLLPYDLGSLRNHRRVHAIPAFSLNAALRRVAAARGNNITLVLDCSFTKARDDNLGYAPRTSRWASVDGRLPAYLDWEIAECWSGNLATSFLQDVDSHVTVVASSEGEMATEYYGRGVFTDALLRTLSIINPAEVAYGQLQELLQSLAQAQKPRCSLSDNDRFVFDSKVSSQVVVTHDVLVHKEQLVMQAGSLHGIARGAGYTCFTSTNPSARPSLTLRATDISDSTSILSLPRALMPSVPASLVVRQSRSSCPAALRLYVLPDKGLGEIMVRIDGSSSALHGNVLCVTSPINAELGLSVANGSVIFEHLFPLSPLGTGLRLSKTVELESSGVARALASAVRWRYYLRLPSDQCLPRGGNELSIKFVEVKQIDKVYDDYLRPLLVPHGRNLLKKRRAEAVPGHKYGIEVRNLSKVSLRVSVFIFNSDFAILSCISPKSTSNRDIHAVVLPQESLEIGYGPRGRQPLIFSVPDGLDCDISAVKVFFTPLPVDLSHLPQDSPFLKRSVPDDKRLLAPLPAPMDSTTFTILQRRL